MTRGLLDTSVLTVLDGLEPEQLPETPCISAVTLAELTVGPLLAGDGATRAARAAQVQHAEAEFDALPFDTAAARAFGRVSASLRARNRKAGARAFDSLIAATALAQGIPVYTCNPDDFEGIEGLEVIAVRLPGVD